MRGYDKASGGEKVVECFVMRLYIINLLSLVSGCATLMPYLHNLQSVPVLFREHVLIKFFQSLQQSCSCLDRVAQQHQSI